MGEKIAVRNPRHGNVDYWISPWPKAKPLLTKLC